MNACDSVFCRIIRRARNSLTDYTVTTDIILLRLNVHITEKCRKMQCVLSFCSDDRYKKTKK